MAKIVGRPLKYFSSWFCPFAHRSTIALEHHRNAVVWEWEEALGWTKTPPLGSENFDADERDDWEYHWKSPDLLRHNPLGMIPTIVDETTGRVVKESIVCVEFVDDIAMEAGSDAPSLFDSCPWKRASARIAMDAINKSICSSYYSVLVRTDPVERRDAFSRILQGLETFAAEIGRGKYWGDRDTIGGPDAVLFPYAFRLFALEHYRGKDFSIPGPERGPLWRTYNTWLERMTEHPSVVPTLPEKSRYLTHVEKYASGKARSKVGNAVRRGVDAHAYDDSKDGIGSQ